MKSFTEQLHPTWKKVLKPHLHELEDIEKSLEGSPFAPSNDDVMRAFSTHFEEVRVLIVGQDPYPNPDFAMGLAFSVSPHIITLPASLKNILKEYQDDTGLEKPHNGDLSRWTEKGVMLLNRTLTLSPGQTNSHGNLGWKNFTFNVAKILSKRQVVAILWGSQAQELTELFPNNIASVHPSPLSAYRGFFGSKPFTKTNAMLKELGLSEVDWNLVK